MSQFPIHTIENAPTGSADMLAAIKAKYGFVPNLLGELAAAPSALRAYLTAVARNRGAVTQPDLQRFLAAGYRREQVLEVLVGVAMKTLSNYTNHIVDTPLDAQFAGFAWQASPV